MPEEKFDTLSSTLMSRFFPWYYLSKINVEDDMDYRCENRYFEHNFFQYDSFDTFSKSEMFHVVQPFLDMLGIESLFRVKSNLFPSTQTLIQHAFHTDLDINHKGAILYLNDCDGYTVFPDGTKIESVANRCLLFDSSKLHASTTCTNEKARLNINVNYL